MDRDGFVMSEGGGCLVLESLDHAIRRDATIYAEVLGGALNSDANHITNPNGDGALRCMQMAIHSSQVDPSQIDYINAHSTSTPVGDVAEVAAVKRLFANTSPPKTLYLSSVKGSLGHLLGAAGAVESIFTIMACKERVIPPAINIKSLDPELRLEEADYLKIVQNEKLVLKNESDKPSKFIALKNSFGFGGTNATICFSSY